MLPLSAGRDAVSVLCSLRPRRSPVVQTESAQAHTPLQHDATCSTGLKRLHSSHIDAEDGCADSCVLPTRAGAPRLQACRITR